MFSAQFSSAPVIRTFLAAVALALGVPAVPAGLDDGRWDPTLPKLLSAGAPGDRWPSPTHRWRRPRRPRSHDGSGAQVPRRGWVSVADRPCGVSWRSGARSCRPSNMRHRPRLHRSGAFPYSWGGGAIKQAERGGVDQDTGKIGYDCSGFVRYAFAGVGAQPPGILGPVHLGRHVFHRRRPNRGDLIF